MTRHPQRTWLAHGLAHAQNKPGRGSHNLPVVLRVMARRHRPTRPLVREHPQACQASAVWQLRDHAYAHPPFFRRFHAAASTTPFRVTGADQGRGMEHFD